MSLLCKDAKAPLASTNDLATCPWCKTKSDSDTSTQVQCQGCNMLFTRVVELDDLSLPQQPSSSRQTPLFGQPSFNVQLPPDWAAKRKGKRRNSSGNARPLKKSQYDSESHNKKRGYHDDDENEEIESDDEDVAALCASRWYLAEKGSKFSRFCRQGKVPLRRVFQLLACPLYSQPPRAFLLNPHLAAKLPMSSHPARMVVRWKIPNVPRGPNSDTKEA